jgi:hypothetical protein
MLIYAKRLVQVMLNIGDIIEGKYQITDVLGQGGWSHVYLARNLKIGNLWAIKEVNIGKESRINLLAEPEILKQLNHRNLPRIIDIFKVGDFLYIIEDYFAGVSLKEYAKCRENCSEEQVVEWGRQLCEILIYLHNLEPNPIIYRDMKPGNIIVDKNNQVKLVDFGIAREYIHGKSSDSTFIGTKGYASPEQYIPGQQSDERTDIYGLGATLYHVITGRSPAEPPYKMVKVREVNKYLSEGIEKIIAKCVENRPELRYQRAEELLKDLDSIKNRKNTGMNSLFQSALTKLQNNIRQEVVVMEKFIGSVIIGIGATGRGAGCTHAAVTMATYLTRQSYQVALVEFNDNPVYYAIEDEDCKEGKITGSFRKNGIDFCKYNLFAQNNRFADVFNAGYNYIIMDLGQLFKLNDSGMPEKSRGYDEMLRADHKVLLSGAAIWQLKDLAPYIIPETETWQFVFNCPDMQLFEEIIEEIDRKICATAFSPDPFNSTDEMEQVMKKILSPVLPVEKKERRIFSWR